MHNGRLGKLCIYPGRQKMSIEEQIKEMEESIERIKAEPWAEAAKRDAIAWKKELIRILEEISDKRRHQLPTRGA